MPPKKKGGKKGKKGGKKSAKDETGSTSGEKIGGKEMNELGKEFFLIQIKDLEQRLSRYQKKCDELGLTNAETEEKYKQLTQDRKEIVDFLKKSLEQRQDEIADLHDRLLGLQQAKDTEKESYENQLSQLKREFQEVKDQLTSENMILGGKLSSLEEFKVQKEDLMKKFADLEEKLQAQDKDHTNKIYSLERKAVVDKDRLKKEMVLRVNTVAAEFRKVSNKQMADTTKRNIRENVSINAQLAKMSEKTKELIHDNDELREKEKQFKMQIELLETTQEELARKNHSNLKVLKMMTSRARQQEAILEELESRDQEYIQVEEESAQLREENNNLGENIHKLDEELTSVKSDLEERTSERDNLIKANDRLEDILSAAATTMHEVLSETPELDETDQLVKRKTMIERLLLVLNSAALTGKAPPPAEFFQQRPKTLMAPLSMVKNAKPDSSRLEPKTPPDFPHYRLGDLGLVPRPPTISSKPAAFASKVTHLSATTRIGIKTNMDLTSINPTTLQKPHRLPTLVQKAT